MEREIGNVAAEAGLQAFRYLSFAPVVFESRPDVPSAAMEAGVLEPAAAQPDVPPSPAVADTDRAAISVALAAKPLDNVAVPVPRAAQPAASKPAFVAHPPPGLFSSTPGMASFTTVTEAATTPAFVVAGPSLSVMPETSQPEPAPAGTPALTAHALPRAPAEQPPASLPAGTPSLRRLAELQAGGAPRAVPAGGGTAMGTGRRYALLKDIRAELAGGPERRAAAPPPAREPPA